MPDSENAPSPTNRDFYDRISRAYDLIADAGEHNARESGERLLAAQPGEQVLEVGFGTGNSLIQLAEAVGPQGKVYGLDISPGMLAVAQGKVQQAGWAGITDLRVGDARSLPWDDASLDAAFMSFTLELFEASDAPQVLAEIRRVLQPGGRLAVVSMAMVPEGQQESVLEKTYKWMHRHFPHIVNCRPIDVARMLADAGLEIARQERLTIWTMPVAAVLAKKTA